MIALLLLLSCGDGTDEDAGPQIEVIETSGPAEIRDVSGFQVLFCHEVEGVERCWDETAEFTLVDGTLSIYGIAPNWWRAGETGCSLWPRWPTPNARDPGFLSGESPELRLAKGRQFMLGHAVRMWPTRDRLDHALQASESGTLNPTWVEWLMGFPLEWTVSDASETP